MRDEPNARLSSGWRLRDRQYQSLGRVALYDRTLRDLDRTLDKDRPAPVAFDLRLVVGQANHALREVGWRDAVTDLESGPEPLRREAERKVIGESLERLTAGGIPENNICIVVRTNEEATEYAGWLHAAGKNVLKLDKNTGDDQASPGIRVATMHRVKGIEFDAVIIGGYRDPEHYANEFAEDNDAGVLVDTLTNERCLLHVAATRAKKYLLYEE